MQEFLWITIFFSSSEGFLTRFLSIRNFIRLLRSSMLQMIHSISAVGIRYSTNVQFIIDRVFVGLFSASTLRQEFETCAMAFLRCRFSLRNTVDSIHHFRWHCKEHRFSWVNSINVRFLNTSSYFSSKDWKNGTDYQQDLTTPEQMKQVLPLVLNYLTPQVRTPLDNFFVKFLMWFQFSGYRFSDLELSRLLLCHRLIHAFFQPAPCSRITFTRASFALT